LRTNEKKQVHVTGFMRVIIKNMSKIYLKVGKVNFEEQNLEEIYYF